MEDSTYVALAIVILNAGADNTNVLHLLPSFVARHHRYFRDKYPALFPSSLPFPSTTTSSSTSTSSTTSALSSRSSSAVRAEDTALFLGAVLANVGRVVNLLHAARYHEAHRLIRVSSQYDPPLPPRYLNSLRSSLSFFVLFSVVLTCTVATAPSCIGWFSQLLALVSTTPSYELIISHWRVQPNR